MKRLALIIPHKESKQGARNHEGETEYSKMGRVLRKVQVQLLDAKIYNGADYSIPLEVGIFRRTSTVEEVCNRVINYAPDISLEVHFNAGGGQGVEILCLAEGKDVRLAQELASLIKQLFGSHLRRLRGAYPLQGHEMGSDNLEIIKEALPNCIPLLAEPFFGDNEVDSKTFSGQGEEKFVKLLVGFILDKFNAKIVKTVMLPLIPKGALKSNQLTDRERLDQLEDQVAQLMSTLGV